MDDVDDDDDDDDDEDDEDDDDDDNLRLRVSDLCGTFCLEFWLTVCRW